MTRRLPKIAFLTTEGHRDILDIGRTWRPLEALTDPHWRRPFGDAARPLVPRYLRRGIRERLLRRWRGDVFELDEAQARRQDLAVLRRCGVEGVGICLLHAPRLRRPRGAPARTGAGRARREIPAPSPAEVSPLAP